MLVNLICCKKQRDDVLLQFVGFCERQKFTSSVEHFWRRVFDEIVEVKVRQEEAVSSVAKVQVFALALIRIFEKSLTCLFQKIITDSI